MLIVFQGSSGSGKTTLCNRLFDLIYKKTEKIHKSIGCTTRPARDWETEGVDYYFLTEEQFREAQNNDLFVAVSKYGDYMYATYKSEIEPHLKAGKIVLAIADLHGTKEYKKLYPNKCLWLFIWVLKSTLKERMKKQGRSEEDVTKRLMLYDAEQKDVYKADYAVDNNPEDAHEVAVDLWFKLEFAFILNKILNS